MKERQILVSTLGSLVIFICYAVYVYSRYVSADAGVINDFKFWGKAIVFLIPLAIAAQIIIHIFFAIVNKIVTREDIPVISDERDKLIELKALRVSYWTFLTGFLLAMGSQAIGMEPWVMFVTMISSAFLGGILEGITQIWFYRKGV